MLSLYYGVPGSGKSYHVIESKLLPWIRKGRPLYVRLDGFHFDKTAEFTGIPEEKLREQITLLDNFEDLRRLHEIVKPGAAVIVDECQNFYGSMSRGGDKLSQEMLGWLEAHRHFHVDLLFICQKPSQLTAAVVRLVEASFDFRNLWFIGLPRHYYYLVRGNPEDDTIIRRSRFYKYRPEVYCYYESYATKGGAEEKEGSIWRSPKFVIAACSLLLVIGIALFHPMLTGAGKVDAGSGKGVAIAPSTPNGRSGSRDTSATMAPTRSGDSEKAGALIKKIVVSGGGGTDALWFWIVNGHIMTLQQIAAVYGVQVQEVTEGGFRRLVGDGITYVTAPRSEVIDAPSTVETIEQLEERAAREYMNAKPQHRSEYGGTTEPTTYDRRTATEQVPGTSQQVEVRPLNRPGVFNPDPPMPIITH